MVAATRPELPAAVDPFVLLREREAAAWRPLARISTPDWCGRELRLPPQTSASPGRYNLRDWPFWREPLEAVDDPAVETMTWMMSTQVGKTTALQAILASRPRVDPAPAMLAGPDRDAVRELRDKFYAMAEVTQAIAGIIPRPRDRNDRWIDIGPVRSHLAWPGNRQRLSGKSCKYVLCTEVDRWKQTPNEGSTHKLIAERVKAFHRSLIVYESTPTDESSIIADLFDLSDQRRYNVPCPRCNWFQELRFFLHKEGKFAGCGGVAGLQDKNGNWLTSDNALEEAYYLCERGCRIESESKTSMVAGGVWCPKGQVVDQRGRLKGEPEQSGRRRGYTLGSLYAETVSFGKIAAEYLECREDQKALQSFLNNWLALRYTATSKAPKWKRLGRRLEGSHGRGFVPPQAVFLTAGIDVQDDCVYWIVRAWGDGCTSWLIDWGRAAMRHNDQGASIYQSDLDQLDDLLLERRFPLVAPDALGRTQLKVRLAAIDYQGHRSWEVAEWVRARSGKGTERLRIIAGDSRVPAGEFFRCSTIDKHAGTGKAYPGGLKRWALDVDAYKDDIAARFAAALDKPGAWWLHQGAVEEAETYLRQICNEAKSLTKTKSGRKKVAWHIVDNRLGNHYWDDEVYARAAADMVTGQDWNGLVERAKRDAKPARGAAKSAGDEDDFSAR